jgi:hypothetical protein
MKVDKRGRNTNCATNKTNVVDNVSDATSHIIMKTEIEDSTHSTELI